MDQSNKAARTKNDDVNGNNSHSSSSSWNSVSRLWHGFQTIGRSSSSPANDVKDKTTPTFEEAASTLLRTTIKPTNPDVTPIQHVCQAASWDCGIACLQMILRWLREDVEDVSNSCQQPTKARSIPLSPTEVLERRALCQRVGSQSIWTVDLVLLLEEILAGDALLDQSKQRQPDLSKQQQQQQKRQPNHDNTSYLFCSQVLGVNASHSTVGYYEKAFATDSQRVNQLCEKMIKQERPMLCPFALKFNQMIQLVSYPHCLAILLIDNHILTNLHQELDDTTEDEKSSEAVQDEDTYMGHYVIVCGVSHDPDAVVKAYGNDNTNLSMLEERPYCFVVANPGLSCAESYVDPFTLERAWTAKGTDCDVIFVARHPQCM